MTQHTLNFSKHSKITLAVFLASALTACSNQAPPVQSEAPVIDRAAADIGDLTDGGKVITSVTTPDNYAKGDKLIAYEGPGWESDKVGYRLYLDGRNALDIFGKKTPEMVLASVGRGEDYHAMADWGMDILKVGNSLGAGGFGVFENGEVRQIGDATNYRAEITEDTDTSAQITVTHINSMSCGENVKAAYTIKAGARLTEVKVRGGCELPFAAGLIIHPNTNGLQSDGDTGWQYFARYGEQSLVPDGLGMAVFYKAEDVSKRGQDSDDDYIVFNSARSPHYYTGAAWAQEVGGLSTQAEFEGWLKSTQAALNAK